MDPSSGPSTRPEIEVVDLVVLQEVGAPRNVSSAGGSGHIRSLADLRREILELFELSEYSPSATKKPQCPRVPNSLVPSDAKGSDDHHFEPKVVSFGPYHHGNPMLVRGENIKLILTAHFIVEINKLHFEWKEFDIGNLLFNMISGNVSELKACYDRESTVKYSDEEFCVMMLVDGCALLFYILYVCIGGDLKVYNVSYQDLSRLHRDALLLENQLPYKLLLDLMSRMPHLSIDDWRLKFQQFSGLIDEPFIQESFEKEKKAYLFLQKMKNFCCGRNANPDEKSRSLAMCPREGADVNASPFIKESFDKQKKAYSFLQKMKNFCCGRNANPDEKSRSLKSRSLAPLSMFSSPREGADVNAIPETEFSSKSCSSIDVNANLDEVFDNPGEEADVESGSNPREEADVESGSNPREEVDVKMWSDPSPDVESGGYAGADVESASNPVADVKSRCNPVLNVKSRSVADVKSRSNPGEGVETIPHLLHFYRTFLLGDKLSSPRDWKDEFGGPGAVGVAKEQVRTSFRNVKELMDAGIRIKRSPTRHLRDISFRSNGITACLRIPPITIDNSTKAMFLNLIAYEMSSDVEHDFISYLRFLDSLIDHADDVEELQSAGVLRNNLGPHEVVAEFFNTVSANLDSNSHYEDVRIRIRKHLVSNYNSKLKMWMTQCLRTYFGSPWTIIAWVGAALALFFTAVQTYFSAFSH